MTPGGARTFHLAVAAAAGGHPRPHQAPGTCSRAGGPWSPHPLASRVPRRVLPSFSPQAAEAGGRRQGRVPRSSQRLCRLPLGPAQRSRFSWRRMGEGVSSPSTGERAAHGSLSPSLSPEGLLHQGGPSISQRRERQAVSRSHEVSLFGTSVTPFPMSCSKLKKQTRFEVDFMRCLARKCDPASDPGRSVLNGTGRYAAKPL